MEAYKITEEMLSIPPFRESHMHYRRVLRKSKEPMYRELVRELQPTGGFTVGTRSVWRSNPVYVDGHFHAAAMLVAFALCSKKDNFVNKIGHQLVQARSDSIDLDNLSDDVFESGVREHPALAKNVYLISFKGLGLSRKLTATGYKPYFNDWDFVQGVICDFCEENNIDRKLYSTLPRGNRTVVEIDLHVDRKGPTTEATEEFYFTEEEKTIYMSSQTQRQRIDAALERIQNSFVG